MRQQEPSPATPSISSQVAADKEAPDSGEASNRLQEGRSDRVSFLRPMYCLPCRDEDKRRRGILDRF